MAELIFCMFINIKVFCKLMLSFLAGLARHAESARANFQYLEYIEISFGMCRVWISCSQFGICEAFRQFANEFANEWIFSKNCELLKSDTSWILSVIYWTRYLVNYFKPIKYPLLNNKVISQRFVVQVTY